MPDISGDIRHIRHIRHSRDTVDTGGQAITG
jgi:hypothetical protein